MSDIAKSIGVILAALALLGATLGAWIQHIVTCIQNQEWLLLIAGAFIAPVGMIHGWGIWLGWW